MEGLNIGGGVQTMPQLNEEKLPYCRCNQLKAIFFCDPKE